MRRVSAADFVRNFSSMSDQALTDAVIITRNGRDRLALVSIDKFNELTSAEPAHEEDRMIGGLYGVAKQMRSSG